MLKQPAENLEGHSIARTDDLPVVFDNVTFAYDNNAPVLRNLSFTVAEGKTVALVGESGGGKSTVFKLLCGFYPLPAEQGTIRIFGQPILDSNPNELRSCFSVVTQDAYLFSGTIADNIAYGREHATMDEVIEAAKLANAHSFIMELPDGYQAEVGERGGFCPADSASGLPLRARSLKTRLSCSWTSLHPRWIRRLNCTFRKR